MKKSIAILMVLITIIIVSSCGAPKEKDFLGRWDGTEYVKMGYYYNYNTTYVFYEDGTYDMYKNREGEEDTNYTSGYGTWSIVDDRHIRIEDYAVGPEVLEFKFDGDKLYLDDEEYIKGEI